MKIYDVPTTDIQEPLPTAYSILLQNSQMTLECTVENSS